jgi:hypothetical protein
VYRNKITFKSYRNLNYKDSSSTGITDYELLVHSHSELILMDDRGSRVRFPAGAGKFLFTTASRTALGPTQPPIQCAPDALFFGVKRPGREADHSRPSNAEVKSAWSYTSSPPIRLSWRGAQSTGSTLHPYRVGVIET